MKKLLFLIGLIPYIGLAQLKSFQKEVFQNKYESYFQVNKTLYCELNKFKGNSYGKTLTNRPFISAFNSNYFKDSSYVYYFDTPLDSAVRYKEYYEYDKYGNLELEMIYSLPLNSNIWAGDVKNEYSYDINGKKILDAKYFWDSDSCKWYCYYKYEFDYDFNGFLNQSAYYSRDLNQKLICQFKNQFTNNNDGYVTNYIYFEFDSELSQLVEKYKEDITLDSNNYFTLRLGYKWEKLNSYWINYYKYEYDNNMQDIFSYVFFKWDIPTNNWIKTNRSESTYNENKDEILNLYFNWDTINNQWKNVFKNEFYYDKNGMDTLSLSFSIDSTSGQYICIRQIEKIYGLNNSIIYSEYNWDLESDTLIGSSKYEADYDEKGNEILYLEYSWNKDFKNWRYFRKSEKSYNKSGNIVFFGYYNWNITNNQWKNIEKRNYFYDSFDNNTTEVIFNWKSELNEWELDAKLYYYYSFPTSTKSINIQEPDNILLYPNPINDLLNIETYNLLSGTCNLYNSRGQFVKSMLVFKGLNTFNMNNLQQGVYFIQIQTTMQNITKKLIKN